MDGITQLRTFAKARGARVTPRILFSSNVPERLEVEARLKVDGAQVSIWASAAHFLVRVRLTTPLTFSVGAPERVCDIDRPADFPAMPGFDVYVSPTGATDDVEAWFKEASHRELVAELVRDPEDAVHVLPSGINYVCRATKALDDAFVPRLLALRRAVEPAVAAPATAPPLDVSMLPADLAALVQQFEDLAEGDDDRRGELQAGLTRRRRTQFLRAITPLLPALNRYLDSVRGPLPDAAIKLGQLGELASEMLVHDGPAA